MLTTIESTDNAIWQTTCKNMADQRYRTLEHEHSVYCTVFLFSVLSIPYPSCKKPQLDTYVQVHKMLKHSGTPCKQISACVSTCCDCATMTPLLSLAAFILAHTARQTTKKLLHTQSWEDQFTCISINSDAQMRL